MYKEEFFPLKEIIDFNGNRYELAHACFKRAYSIVIENRERRDFIEDDEDCVYIPTPDEYKELTKQKKIKITELALYDILKDKVKYYMDKGTI
ncbi:MAG: hypothetical protein N3A58_05700 [Spirochaetes bacterium]|nr:hypothetical protein [Spirochaetota bacterium]